MDEDDGDLAGLVRVEHVEADAFVEGRGIEDAEDGIGAVIPDGQLPSEGHRHVVGEGDGGFARSRSPEHVGLDDRVMQLKDGEGAVRRFWGAENGGGRLEVDRGKVAIGLAGGFGW